MHKQPIMNIAQRIAVTEELLLLSKFMYKSQLIIVWLGRSLLRLLRLFWATLVLSSAMIKGEREGK